MTCRYFLLAVMLTVALMLASCVAPGGLQTSDSAAATAVIETALAEIVQTELAQAVTPLPPTDMAVLPTATITLTPTPAFTSTPAAPQLSVSVDTNCRTGPGRIYDYVGALVVGEKAQPLGRDSGGAYWYVRLGSGAMCWIWGEYASVAGDVAQLPVFTPPPTPTPPPDFSVAYDYLESCVGWDPAFKVTNTGGVTFKSYYVKVRDTVTNEMQDEYGNNFDKRAGCAIAESIPALTQSKTGWVYANSFVSNPTGHLMKAEVKLCTEINQAGMCVSKSLEFTP
ncbi:MAG: hypothetical protein WHV44_03865 [Anaerolineales bacterium]